MMKPVVEGRMLQALDLQPGEDVLEIGTGSGFSTACLAALAREVLSLEIDPALAAAARANLTTAAWAATCVSRPPTCSAGRASAASTPSV